MFVSNKIWYLFEIICFHFSGLLYARTYRTAIFEPDTTKIHLTPPYHESQKLRPTRDCSISIPHETVRSLVLNMPRIKEVLLADQWVFIIIIIIIIPLQYLFNYDIYLIMTLKNDWIYNSYFRILEKTLLSNNIYIQIIKDGGCCKIDVRRYFTSVSQLGNYCDYIETRE